MLIEKRDAFEKGELYDVIQGAEYPQTAEECEKVISLLEDLKINYFHVHPQNELSDKFSNQIKVEDIYGTKLKGKLESYQTNFFATDLPHNMRVFFFKEIFDELRQVKEFQYFKEI